MESSDRFKEGEMGEERQEARKERKEGWRDGRRKRRKGRRTEGEREGEGKYSPLCLKEAFSPPWAEERILPFHWFWKQSIGKRTSNVVSPDVRLTVAWLSAACDISICFCACSCCLNRFSVFNKEQASLAIFPCSAV